MMHQIRQQLLPFERMSHEPLHSFFGYYDLQPWSADGAYHLCHRVGFMDRMQTMSDCAELGMIRQYDDCFIPLASTYAWNFQQGSMLQWNPSAPNREIIYNAFLRNEFKGIVKDIQTGASRILPRPAATVSPSGRYALSINFSRLADFRPGYGYAGIPDRNMSISAPEDDGIFLIDINRNTEKLILSLKKIQALFERKFRCTDPKILVNHITFNPAGDRFVALVRNMPMHGSESDGWSTLVFTADINGDNLHVFEGYGCASHYAWRDPEHLLIYADNIGAGKMALCLLKDFSQETKALDPAFFAFDGHCSFSSDKRFILYDSYPDSDGYRKLLLYDLEQQHGFTLAELFSGRRPLQYCEDMRCDLHPRWNRDGSMISFDSVHEGYRHVYRMDLSTIL